MKKIFLFLLFFYTFSFSSSLSSIPISYFAHGRTIPSSDAPSNIFPDFFVFPGSTPGSFFKKGVTYVKNGGVTETDRGGLGPYGPNYYTFSYFFSSPVLTATLHNSSYSGRVPFYKQYYKRLVCAKGFNPVNGKCVSPCSTGQVRNSSGECVDVCKFKPPVTMGKLPFLKSFNTTSAALDYVNSNHFTNVKLYSLKDLSAYSNISTLGCPNYYLYSDNNSSAGTVCNNVSYSLVINGFPFQAIFKTNSGCMYYIDHNAQGYGVCKQYGDCNFVFGYYKSNKKDNNISKPDFNSSIVPQIHSVDENISNFDNNFTSPNNTVDKNDTSNISPLLGQIKQLSNNNHSDMSKLFYNTIKVNHNLNTLINLMGATTNKLSSIVSNTASTSSNTKNIADNTNKISKSLSGTFNKTTVKTALSNAKAIFKDNNSSSSDSNLSSSSVIGLYNGFSQKSEKALTSMFNHIDFGINSIFNVPFYNFVDVPFPPVDIDFLHLHLHGKIINASFFNSLDFGLLKMFFILLTLLWSVKYIFDRLF